MTALRSPFRPRFSRQNAADLAHILNVLSETHRLQIVSILWQRGENGAFGEELTSVLGLTQPTVSIHLGKLYDAGLLSRERTGRYVIYRLHMPRLTEIVGALQLAGAAS